MASNLRPLGPTVQKTLVSPTHSSSIIGSSHGLEKSCSAHHDQVEPYSHTHQLAGFISRSGQATRHVHGPFHGLPLARPCIHLRPTKGMAVQPIADPELRSAAHQSSCNRNNRTLSSPNGEFISAPHVPHSSTLDLHSQPSDARHLRGASSSALSPRRASSPVFVHSISGREHDHNDRRLYAAHPSVNRRCFSSPSSCLTASFRFRRLSSRKSVKLYERQDAMCGPADAVPFVILQRRAFPTKRHATLSSYNPPDTVQVGRWSLAPSRRPTTIQPDTGADCHWIVDDPSLTPGNHEAAAGDRRK
jgi:hypothetical protein